MGATASITVPAEAAALGRLVGFLGAFWEAHDLPLADTMRFELCLEEVFVNVVTHGIEGVAPPPGHDAHPVTVALDLDGDRLAMVVEDHGMEFDPLAQDAVDTDAPMEERGIGGLGIHLVKTLMQESRYERSGDRNRLVMVGVLDRG
ncbi:MAG: ATP-binding protein [Chloroflexota bacterium]